MFSHPRTGTIPDTLQPMKKIPEVCSKCRRDLEERKERNSMVDDGREAAKDGVQSALEFLRM